MNAKTPDQVLAACSETFRERNAIYGDNYKQFGAIMKAFFPNGIQLQTVADFDRFTLFQNCMAKLSRYANTLPTGGHVDSAHDLSVYAAMLECATKENSQP